MTVRSNKGQTLTPVYGSKLKRRRSVCSTCDQVWEYTSGSFRPKCDDCIEAAKSKTDPANSKYVGASEKADIKRALKTAFNPAEFRRTMEHAKAKGWITEAKICGV